MPQINKNWPHSVIKFKRWYNCGTENILEYGLECSFKIEHFTILEFLNWYPFYSSSFTVNYVAIYEKVSMKLKIYKPEFGIF